MRSVTDPFLLSASGNDPAPAAKPDSRKDDLARRAGVPRAVLDIVPVEHIEAFVTRVESWADLSADLRRTFKAAGFRQHDPWGPGGGFHIASHLSDDGVLVSWATTEYTTDAPGTFEHTVTQIMQPALQAILASCGFAAQTIPDGQDNAGYLLVTGHTDPQN